VVREIDFEWCDTFVKEVLLAEERANLRSVSGFPYAALAGEQIVGLFKEGGGRP